MQNSPKDSKITTVSDNGKTKNHCEFLPQTYVWKVLRSLTDDLSDYLHPEDLEMIDYIIRLRDFQSYLCLSDIWGLQSMNSQGILSFDELKARYFLASLLKKFQFPSEKSSRRDKAKKKFLQAESQCKHFNTVGFKQLTADGEETAEFVTYARSFLKKLLGPVCPTLPQLVDSSRHGPGGNLDTQDGQVSSYYKYANWPYSCTLRALPVARFLIESDKRWLGALEDDYRERFNLPKHTILNQQEFWENVLVVKDFNRVGFVPKNALTDRSIAPEPTMNVMLQLAVEGHIRKYLKRWDINLDSQTKNQRLSRLGSITNQYATIDLSAASDTISLKLCELLLPEDWYNYLLRIRSPKGVLDGEEIVYSKISSMGNGFTFALESAIFAAVVFAVQKLKTGTINTANVAIYGDDIIVESSIAKDVCLYLRKCGFTVNSDKSFFEGPIRESCGTDWHCGRSLRPVFLNEHPTGVTELWCDINRIKRSLSLLFGIEKSKTEQLMCSWIPDKFKGIKGPLSDTDFDSYLHSNSFAGIPYVNGCWEYTRLVPTIPRVRGCSKFFFRKLMHNLKPAEQGIKFDKTKFKVEIKSNLESCGSRFTVVPGYSSVNFGKKVSRASIWPVEYRFYWLTSH